MIPENVENFNDELFVGVAYGKFTQRVQNEVDAHRTRSLQNGKMIFEKTFNSLRDCILLSVNEAGNPETGTSFIFKMEGGSLIMHENSKYLYDFLLRCRNLDIAKKFTLKVFDIETEEGKTKSFLVPYQNGKKVNREYGGIPEWKKIEKDDGKIFYDNTKALYFLIEKLIEKVNYLKQKKKDAKINKEVKNKKEWDSDSESKDLPF